MLGFARNAEITVPGMTDADLKPLLNSIQIEHHRDRAVLHATLPMPLLQRLVTPENLQPMPAAGGGSK